ncbi:MAG: hypothetical protein ABIR94_20525, partial [Rubrivivax sp.]
MSGASSSGKPLEDRAQIEAAVEQVLNLREVSVRVFDEAEGVVRAGQRGLQVTEDRVDGQERRVLDAGHAAAGDVLLVQDPHASNRGEAPQAIGDERGRRGQRSRGETLDR